MADKDTERQIRELKERVKKLERVLEWELGVDLRPTPPDEPQVAECWACEKEFEITVHTGLQCPHCGELQSDEPEGEA